MREMLSLLLCIVGIARAQNPLTVFVDIHTALLRQDPRFVSHQSETFISLSMASSFKDPRFIRAASHLSPSTMRVGGTSADFVNYTLDYQEVHFVCVPNKDYPFPMYPGLNFSLYALEALVNFTVQAGFTLMLDINELTGRSCNSRGCGNTTWDTRSLRTFLEHIRSNGIPLDALEMGNELWAGRGPFIEQDVLVLSRILDDIWGNASDRPALFAPGDACTHYQTEALWPIITALPGRRGVSFHDYSPGPNKVLDAPSLRALGVNGEGCFDPWNAGPRHAGVGLWVTESASTAAPIPLLQSFEEGFFTLAAIGGYAKTGLGRWARTQLTDANEQNSDGCFTFGLLHPHEDQWDAAADYWVMVVHQQTVGSGVLNATAVDPSSSLQGYLHSTAVFFAYCGVAPGSVVVAAVNVGGEGATLELLDIGGGPLTTTPRLEWVLTAPGGNLSATAPLLNGMGPPLRLQPDGSLPEMLPSVIPSSGPSGLFLPPFSQAFFVLQSVGADACP